MNGEERMEERVAGRVMVISREGKAIWGDMGAWAP